MPSFVKQTHLLALRALPLVVCAGCYSTSTRTEQSGSDARNEVRAPNCHDTPVAADLAISSRIPAVHAMDVATDSAIVAQFNKPILTDASRWPIALYTYPEGELVRMPNRIVSTYDAETCTLSLPIQNSLLQNTAYEAVIDGSVTDLAGQPLLDIGPADRTVHWVFTTRPEIADPQPMVIFVTPTPPDREVSLLEPITIQFSEPVIVPPAAAVIGVYRVYGPGQPDELIREYRPREIAYDSNTNTLSTLTRQNFEPNTFYEIRMSGEITDLTGNRLVDAATSIPYRFWTFRTRGQ